MPINVSETQYEIGDTPHIELREYNDGKRVDLDDWCMSMLGALTLPGTPYRYELRDKTETTGHMQYVDGELVRFNSVEIFGPKAPHWRDISNTCAIDYEGALYQISLREFGRATVSFY